jgi:pyruvate/2-oxoglutarate dehydrogenase complex dihydrolipoamide dehydrogenase (E3) component
VNALFLPFEKHKVGYRVIPWATFTSPEVACVGMRRSEAKTVKNLANYQVTTSTHDIDNLDCAIRDGEAKGFIKDITKGNKDEIVGLTIVLPISIVLYEHTLSIT